MSGVRDTSLKQVFDLRSSSATTRIVLLKATPTVWTAVEIPSSSTWAVRKSEEESEKIRKIRDASSGSSG